MEMEELVLRRRRIKELIITGSWKKHDVLKGTKVEEAGNGWGREGRRKFPEA